ncbi:MAG: TetR family transcriptional regulator C-terminal domain-containing protein [Nocardioides alkalitolerans]
MAGETATQEERSQAARRTLIAAAIDILAEEGYRRLTFTRIQEVAGLSRGLVAYHFGTKVALVEGVIAVIREQYHDQAQHDPSRTGYDEVRGMVRTYLDRFRADPRPAKVMLVLGTDSIGEPGPVTDAVRETYQSFRDDLARFLERGLADGSIRAGIDPGAHAIVIEAFLRGIVLQYLVDPTRVDLDAVTAAAYQTVDALAGPAGG